MSIELEKKYKVVFNNTPGDKGSTAIHASVNGKTWNIPRETEVVVPGYLLLHLMNSEEISYDTTGKGTAIKRFPFSMVGEVEETATATDETTAKKTKAA